MLIAAACGNGKDATFDLPPGASFDSVRGDRVLIVVEAKNDCQSQGNCASDATAAADPAACDLGQGNTRGLAVYRLGANGMLFHDPSSDGPPGGPEQTIATATNPRRVTVHPNDSSLIYVATIERVQVFRLAANGATRCIGQTLSEKEANSPFDEKLDPIDMAIDPSIGDGVLYVAASGANRIDAYAMAPDGTIPGVPTSCVVGSLFAEFAAVTLASDDFVIAGGRSSIAVYRRQAGQFPPPNPDPLATPTPSPSPALPACTGARLITEPVSSIGAAFVTDMLFWPSAQAPLGELVVSEEFSRQIVTFPIDAAGLLDAEGTSSTARAGVYQNLLRNELDSQPVLYASVFNEGRIDAFRLENGRLPPGAFSSTAADPRTLPVGMAIDVSGSVLYVAQGGLGRVDGFRILPGGGLDALPTTGTRPILTANGSRLDTFPNDVAIVALP